TEWTSGTELGRAVQDCTKQTYIGIEVGGSGGHHVTRALERKALKCWLGPLACTSRGPWRLVPMFEY
ncbi:hypothetical protein PAXRUDRAFT_786371, partial [Paxillus rubicundulus Ve08.2h10]